MVMRSEDLLVLLRALMRLTMPTGTIVIVNDLGLDRLVIHCVYVSRVTTKFCEGKKRNLAGGLSKEGRIRTGVVRVLISMRHVLKWRIVGDQERTGGEVVLRVLECEV